MLVKITSNTSGEIIMFAEHLHALFQIIGKECTPRGVFITEQLPEAIAKLHQAVDKEKQELHEAEHQLHKMAHDDEDHNSGKVNVHLAQRAHPLIQMMEWTLKEGGFILWECDKDF